MIEFDSYEEIKSYFNKLGFLEFDNQLELDADNNPRKFFQRRYRDVQGTKFFIDAYVFDWRACGARYQGCNFSVEFRCQLYRTNSHDAINLVFIHQDLDEVINFVESLFDNNLVEHYESY